MNAIQRAIAVPPDEVVVDRAASRKIFRKVAPLAAGAQDIHDPIHHRGARCVLMHRAARRDQFARIEPVRRIVQLLVGRVDVGADGIDIRLRIEGLMNLVADLRAVRSEPRKAA